MLGSAVLSLSDGPLPLCGGWLRRGAAPHLKSQSEREREKKRLGSTMSGENRDTTEINEGDESVT